MDAADASSMEGTRRGGRPTMAGYMHGYSAPKRNSSFSSGHRANFAAGDEAMDTSVNFQNTVTFDDKPSNAHNRSMVDVFLSEETNNNATAAMEDYLPKGGSERVNPIKKCLFYGCVVIAFIIIFITVPKRGGGGSESNAAAAAAGGPTPAPSMAEAEELSPTMSPTPAEQILIEEEASIDTKPTTNQDEENTAEEQEEIWARSQAMEKYVLANAISTEEHLSDKTSPAAKAIEWIAGEDPTKPGIPGYGDIEIDSQSLEALLLLQKYALKTFYYSIEEIDLHEGRERLLQQGGSAQEIKNRQTFDETWNHRQDVCQWHGITCNERGFVTELHLSHTLLEGTLVPEIFQEQAMLELVYLDLSFNKFKGTFPDQTIVNDVLRELWIDHNRLEGTIDNIIGPFAQLLQLDLQDNQFTGTLPSQWSHMTELEVLKLAANHLEGPLPAEMGEMTSMEWFQLDVNQLTGTIPTELAKMNHLHTIKMANNQLTGKLPEVLADLPMTHISLNDNKLTGEVPAAFGKLSILEDLHLHGNDLEGSMPEEVCALVEDDQTMQKLTADCEEPKIECSCCTKCY